MKVTQLCIYPIKSLRGISLPSWNVCAQGLGYDRRYILLKGSADNPLHAMFVGIQPEMALFHTMLSTPNGEESTTFRVEYHLPDPPISPKTSSQTQGIDIPFSPEVKSLKQIQLKMHTDPNYRAYVMPNEINHWFSECFGYSVILAYLGDGLGIKKDDEISQNWVQAIKPAIPNSVSAINFSDGAPLLVTSESSLADLEPRLGGEKVVLEKFRPNIVVDGEGVAWDEDFWGEVTIARTGLNIVLTANCARCTSINVDLNQGTMAEGESGKLLKKMMRDRRIDTGNKWSPIFGRYGFPTRGGDIRVGDEVVVSRRNEAHTVWSGVMPRLAHVDEISV